MVVVMNDPTPLSCLKKVKSMLPLKRDLISYHLI